MSEKAWKDPIVEEVKKIRKELDKEFEKDPKGSMERGRREAIKAGFKFVSSPSSSDKRKSGTGKK